MEKLDILNLIYRLTVATQW